MSDGKRILWTVVTTRDLDMALEEAIKRNGHVSKSDFIRDVVRRELRKRDML